MFRAGQVRLEKMSPMNKQVIHLGAINNATHVSIYPHNTWFIEIRTRAPWHAFTGCVLFQAWQNHLLETFKEEGKTGASGKGCLRIIKIK